MEELKHSQEIINLGKKLITEFSKKDQKDTTLSWMAHYLSELITSTDDELHQEKKIQLQKKTCTVILNIWKNRKDFPRGLRPLSGLASAVEVINSLKANDPNIDYWERTRRYEDNSPWGNFAEVLRNSSQNIFALTVFASIGNEILLNEKEWLKFPNLLSDDEKQILEYIDQILNRDENPIKIVFTTQGKKKKKRKLEKIDEVFDRIEELLMLQLSKFEALKKSILEAKKVSGSLENDLSCDCD